MAVSNANLNIAQSSRLLNDSFFTPLSPLSSCLLLVIAMEVTSCLESYLSTHFVVALASQT